MGAWERVKKSNKVKKELVVKSNKETRARAVVTC